MPQRVSGVDRTLIVGIAALFTVFPLGPPGGVIVVGAATAVLTAVGWLRRGRPAVHVGLFCTLCIAVVLSGTRFSQLWFGLGIAMYAALVHAIPWLRGTVGWARWGTFGRDVCLLCVTFVLLAASALVAWFVVFRPDIGDLLQAFVPDLPAWELMAAALLFAMVNAAVEEIAYRGVIMHALESALGPGEASLVLQAVAFGTLHINGFPRGWVGVALACIYGVMMGVIRRRARGMLAPWVAHVCTDLVIVAIVLMLGRG